MWYTGLAPTTSFQTDGAIGFDTFAHLNLGMCIICMHVFESFFGQQVVKKVRESYFSVEVSCYMGIFGRMRAKVRERKVFFFVLFFSFKRHGMACKKEKRLGEL